MRGAQVTRWEKLSVSKKCYTITRGPASQKCGVQCKKHSPAAFKLTGHEIGLKGAKILEGYFKKLKKANS